MPARAALADLGSEANVVTSQGKVVKSCLTKDGKSAAKSVRFRADSDSNSDRLPEYCMCDMPCVQATKQRLFACDQCDEWHGESCVVELSGDDGKAYSCLPCRKETLLHKLVDKVKRQKPPSLDQIQTVCAKLRVPLPLHPTQGDMIVHLATFLVRSPEIREKLASGNMTFHDVVAQAEAGGVRRGHQGQLELINGMKFADLRTACRLCAVPSAGSKEALVGRLRSFLTAATQATHGRRRSSYGRQVVTTMKPLDAITEEEEDSQAPTPASDRGEDKENAGPRAKEEASRNKLLKRLKVFKVAELRTECRSKTLASTGKKEDLMCRLADHMLSQAQGRTHGEDCDCDICDLDTAMLLHDLDKQMRMC